MNTLWTDRPDPVGIHFRSTPGHGYIDISPERLAQIPAVLKTPTRFYTAGCRSFEEDCEWARVALAFPQYFIGEEYKRARWTLANTHPAIYAAWTAEGFPTATVQTGKKRYNIRQNIGKAKYVVNFHDGVKTHNDGSEFYDIKIFSNKKNLAAFIADLTRQGYTEQ